MTKYRSGDAGAGRLSKKRTDKSAEKIMHKFKKPPVDHRSAMGELSPKATLPPLFDIATGEQIM